MLNTATTAWRQSAPELFPDAGQHFVELAIDSFGTDERKNEMELKEYNEVLLDDWKQQRLGKSEEVYTKNIWQIDVWPLSFELFNNVRNGTLIANVLK